tara:strand:- start:383 stop:952 length:570 start_codon:yes stop_codon:yes gene_type:complete
VKYLFVHIPKSGGTSIKRILTNDFKTGHIPAKTYWEKGDHHSLVTSFSIVRNPFDRLVSSYFHLKKEDKKLNRVTTKEDTFKSWFHNVFSNYPLTTKHYSWIYTLPQHYWITYKDKIVIENILKIENLDEDVKKFSSKYNLNLPTAIPRLNKTSHSHYSTYYDKEMIKVVEKVYENDLVQFDYKFDTLS